MNRIGIITAQVSRPAKAAWMPRNSRIIILEKMGPLSTPLKIMRRLEKLLKLFIPPIISAPIRARRKRREEQRYDGIPDRNFYDDVFSPWLGYGDFDPLFDAIRPYSLVSPFRARKFLRNRSVQGRHRLAVEKNPGNQSARQTTPPVRYLRRHTGSNARATHRPGDRVQAVMMT